MFFIGSCQVLGAGTGSADLINISRLEAGWGVRVVGDLVPAGSGAGEKPRI
jgi:hypothetical protein